jgi:hypothetical protein
MHLWSTPWTLPSSVCCAHRSRVLRSLTVPSPLSIERQAAPAAAVSLTGAAAQLPLAGRARVSL